MSTTISHRSPSPLHALVDAFKALFAGGAAGTGEVWRLYRLAGNADSVSPAVVRALAAGQVAKP